jgi:glycosyltransferase involved in cell wall biosynthesis
MSIFDAGREAGGRHKSLPAPQASKEIYWAGDIGDRCAGKLSLALDDEMAKFGRHDIPQKAFSRVAISVVAVPLAEVLGDKMRRDSQLSGSAAHQSPHRLPPPQPGRPPLHQADSIVGFSRQVNEALLRDGVPESRALAIYNGIDFARLATTPTDDLHTRFAIPKDAVVIGAIGSLIPRKGNDVLLRATPPLTDHTRRTC